MAYKPPPELRARVENIKKKFEVVSDVPASNSNGDLPKAVNGKSKLLNNYNESSAGKSLLVRNLLGSDSSGTKLSKEPTPAKVEKLPSNSSTRGNIRRSPAFRCDKTMRSPNVAGQPAASWARPQSVVNHRVKMFEGEQQSVKRRVTQMHLHDIKSATRVCEKQHINKEAASSGPEKLENKFTTSPVLPTKRVGKSGNVSEEVEVDSVNSALVSGSTFEPVPTKEVAITSGYASIIKTLKSSPVHRINANKCDESKSSSKTKDLVVHRKDGDACQENVSNDKQKGDADRVMVPNKFSESEKAEQSKDWGREGRDNSLTQSLRAALRAPLPGGPPPKKPPRTFVHSSPATPRLGSSVQDRIDNLEAVKTISPGPDVQERIDNLQVMKPSSPGSNVQERIDDLQVMKPISPGSNVQDRIDNLQVMKPISPGQETGENEKPRPSRAKTEPHIMLKKLETALLNRQKGIGGVVITPKTPVLSCRNPLHSPAGKGGGGRAGPLPSLPAVPAVAGKQDVSALLGGCLDSLSCVSATDPHYVQGHFYEKLAEKQSEFFIDVVSHLRASVSSNQSLVNCNSGAGLKKSRSEEHIYAEPYAFLSDEEKLARLNKSEGKSDRRGSAVPVSKLPKPQALHYMCTPITVSPLDRLDALTNTSSNINEALNLAIKVPNKAEQSSWKLSTLAKSLQNNSSGDSINKLDRSKIQLFMNQAFGSPVQGLPITPIGEPSSDCESVASSPEETFPPVFSSEDEGPGVDEHSRGKLKPTTSSDDSTSIASLELSKLTEERKVYVRRVSSRIFNSCQRLTSPDSFPHLFHCVMLVGLNLDSEKRIKVPYIKKKYPPNATVPPHIEYLCFPDASDWPPPSLPPGASSTKTEEQCYSLVITNEAGERKFGYCRRVMPEGAHICLPLAYCVISPFRAKGFYYKILQELESRHGQPEWLQTAFIKELYACEFPTPGQVLKPPAPHYGGHTDSLVSCIANQLRRPLDVRLEERDLTQLFSTLSVHVLLQVFGSLLLERKVLFVSSSLNKLSACIEALESILYPFSWQYTFIPVLPTTKLEVCEAPTPYIIGVLKGKDGKAPAVHVEDGIAVDLEDSRILQCVGDESTILPARLKRGLKLALQLVESTTEEHEPSRNVLVSEAFIRMFVEVCGHYSNHIVAQQDGRKVFERESFIKAVPSRNIQLFLEWFAETGMFTIFLESRLNNIETKGIFEQRALEHTEEMDKNTMLFLRNYKALNKKVKTFGDRFKDWTLFT